MKQEYDFSKSKNNPYAEKLNDQSIRRLKFSILPGSMRTGSFNKKLARNVIRVLQSKSHECDGLDLREFSIPLYDGDIEDSTGIPSGVSELGQRIKDSDALIVVTPEYNASIPGVLKNAIDWLSRIKPNILSQKNVLLLSASPGYFGGIRSLAATRIPFELLESYVFPKTFSLPKANEAFTPEETFVDPKNEEKLVKLLEDFIAHIQ